MESLGWWVASIALVAAMIAAWYALRIRRRARATEAAVRLLLPGGAQSEIVGGVRAALDDGAQRYRALEAENDWLRTILAALDDAVIVVGPGQKILSVNDAAHHPLPDEFRHRARPNGDRTDRRSRDRRTRAALLN